MSEERGARPITSQPTFSSEREITHVVNKGNAAAKQDRVALFAAIAEAAAGRYASATRKREM